SACESRSSRSRVWLRERATNSSTWRRLYPRIWTSKVPSLSRSVIRSASSVMVAPRRNLAGSTPVARPGGAELAVGSGRPGRLGLVARDAGRGYGREYGGNGHDSRPLPHPGATETDNYPVLP